MHFCNQWSLYAQAQVFDICISTKMQKTYVGRIYSKMMICVNTCTYLYWLAENGTATAADHLLMAVLKQFVILAQ